MMAVTDSQKQAHYRYEKKALKRIPLDVQKDQYAQIQNAAAAAGESVNGYIKGAILQRMERDARQQAPGSVPE